MHEAVNRNRCSPRRSPSPRRILSAVVILAAAVPAGPATVPGLVAQQGAAGGNWLYYGGDAGSTKYSPLDQITADNVADLEIAWRWESRNFGDRPEFNYRVTPLAVNGTLYVTAGYRRAVVAIDGATGETLWMYRMDEGVRAETAPRANSGRGVAWWTDGQAERVLVITPAYHMVSLDARTGRPDPAFGQDGVVDLRRDFGPREVDIDNDPLGSSSPPVIVGDVAVVGTALPSGSSPPKPDMPPGHVRGYDVRTGERLWIFHTIPQEGEYGNDTWLEGSWRYTGNAAVWTPFSADLERGYVYLPIEAPTGDYYGGHHPGDNLFSQSLVCLDARTGERVWHFQMVRHGIWDYDPPAPPILLDITVDGRTIPAVAQVTKQAFTYVFDRYTGEPVWPIEERPVAPSEVPGEWTAPTQPFPTRPAPFDRQGVSVDDLIDFTPELRAEALDMVSRLVIGPLYTPPSVIDLDDPNGTLGTLVLPGSLGGANWPGGSVDVETGILYVTSVTSPSVHGLINDPEISSMDYISGRAFRRVRGGGPQGLPLIKPPWGRITAIDLNTGDHVWMRPNGDTPDYVREHPALAGVDIPPTGKPDRGGTMVTRTLLFAGEGGGMFAAFGSGGNKLRAHDKATGEILYEFELPANQTGVPMTYLADGRQFVVVAVGDRGHAAELVALALPQ